MPESKNPSPAPKAEPDRNDVLCVLDRLLEDYGTDKRLRNGLIIAKNAIVGLRARPAAAPAEVDELSWTIPEGPGTRAELR